MAKMFKPKTPTVSVASSEPDKATQKAQRRQAKSIDDQTAEEAREMGSRNRLIASRRQGGGLFSRLGGASGVRETLG